MEEKSGLAKQQTLSMENPPYTLDVPTHVAIIMDGNGRWATERGLSRLEGHRVGTENIRRVAGCASRLGVRYLTIYAFSTENWIRPDQEVQGLMRIFKEVLGQEVQHLHREGIRIHHLGRLDRLPTELQVSVQHALELTKLNTGLTLSVAFDYGGRDEIVQAVQRIVEDKIPAAQVDAALVNRYLYTADLPEPDLIIRTAGELRMSNFLLWQAAYSEYYCTMVPWPEFGEREVEEALAAYRQRQRRFGGLSPRQDA
jgi:undecaprenyl diphosphate synthase